MKTPEQFAPASAGAIALASALAGNDDEQITKRLRRCFDANTRCEIDPSSVPLLLLRDRRLKLVLRP